MAQQIFDFFERRAIWEAHNKRCGHCREPVSFATLEIDHIIPEHLKNASAEEWEKSCGEYNLSRQFNIFGFENLISSCVVCNSRKSGKILPPGITGILLSIAEKEKTKIENLIKKYKKNNKLDNLRFSISSALDSGALDPDQIPQILFSARNKVGTFKLSSPLAIFGDTTINELSREKYEEYLDTILQLPEWLSVGLRLIKDDEVEVYVKTLREYQKAVDDGYYPYSNAEIKTAYAYFVRPISLLNILLKAKLAENSYIDDPKRGLADITLLPASLLFSFDTSEDLSPNTLQNNKSIADLVSSGTARITQIGSDLISIEYDECWTTMFELMRADVDEDGIQELIVHWGGGPTMGTLVVGDVKVLKRNGEEEKFQVED